MASSLSRTGMSPAGQLRTLATYKGIVIAQDSECPSLMVKPTFCGQTRKVGNVPKADIGRAYVAEGLCPDGAIWIAEKTRNVPLCAAPDIGGSCPWADQDSGC